MPTGRSRRASERTGGDLDEAKIAGLQVRMGSGELKARQLVERYLERIEAIDRGGPTLRSIIEVNPEAITIADALDGECVERGPRGRCMGCDRSD